MKLYAVIPYKYSANFYYRIMLPFVTAKKMGLADIVLDTPELKVERETERRAIATTYADIILHYQNPSPGFKLSRDMAAKFPAYWETKDKWNFGPNFVLDTDDDLFNVEPMNPAFGKSGTNVNGVPLKRGEAVIVEGADGKPVTLWEDGKKDENGNVPFDIEANARALHHVRENLKAADLVTCTTPAVAEYVARETGRTDSHVFPNCIDFKRFPKVELAQDDKVRILWQSSSTHFEDIWPLAKALGRVHKKYNNVEIILFGSPYPWLTKELVEERTTVIPWTTYEEYFWQVSVLNTDIALAPLHDSPFNRSRTAIRMYEAAATWKPAATLAEDTGPYHADIISGETGLLFKGEEDFETKLCGMIEDRALVRRLAANAKDWVRTNRDPAVHVPKLIEAYQRLRDIRRSVTEPPAPLTEEEIKAHGSVPADDADVREREDAGSPVS